MCHVVRLSDAAQPSYPIVSCDWNEMTAAMNWLAWFDDAVKSWFQMNLLFHVPVVTHP